MLTTIPPTLVVEEMPKIEANFARVCDILFAWLDGYIVAFNIQHPFSRVKI